MLQNSALKINDFDINDIVKGKKFTPLKGIVYGDNGVGKTWMLSKAKSPLILDMEGNCGHIEADKKEVRTFDQFIGALNYLINNESEYKSLVIDSLDSLQNIIGERIGQTYTDKDLSYGKNSGIWAKIIKDVVAKLETLHQVKGINILFTAHWKVKAANNPMTEQYDRFDMKINEEMRTGFCNWAQFILLAMKDVILEEETTGFGKKKAKTVINRVLYTRGEPTYYGKNVFNLPQKIKLDWDEFAGHVKSFYTN